MINLLSAFRREDHFIRLNREFHLDLTWCCEFFHSWNGHSFLSYPKWAPVPDLQISSDATGSIGYGAIIGQEWFVGVWSAAQMPLSIAYKELFPVVLAASLWGHQWSAKRLEFCSDNSVVLEVLRSGTSRNSNMMVLLRHLSMLAARHSFAFTARHVAGSSNLVADALSRFDFQRFRQLVPQASPTATLVPPSLLAQLPLIMAFLILRYIAFNSSVSSVALNATKAPVNHSARNSRPHAYSPISGLAKPRSHHALGCLLLKC